MLRVGHGESGGSGGLLSLEGSVRDEGEVVAVEREEEEEERWDSNGKARDDDDGEDGDDDALDDTINDDDGESVDKSATLQSNSSFSS